MSSPEPSGRPRVAIGPTTDPLLCDAVARGEAEPAPLDAADALVWAGNDPAEFPAELPASIRWVQLPSAGVEEWFAAGVIQSHPQVLWTSAAGAFSATVAEHAFAMLLAGVRALPEHLAATTWRQRDFFDKVGTLRGARVAIIGAGGIGRALIPMLAAVGATVVAVNRSGRPVHGAAETVPADRVDDVFGRVDHVVVAAPATGATRHLVGRDQLAALHTRSWVVNVARGSLVDTDALVEALRDNRIGGAGLDVTDPEPLPDGHPLWSLPNAIVTPHDSNPPSVRKPAYAEHVADNVRRFVRGEDLVAEIDPEAGY
ncbi:D-isomer specific 2-hydroxyacid dehydrogenase family protein [Rhodococcus sp. SGAir0479]|uniref:D-isomer specific 2-hydroxyacid dehydrogenase family protein n=1 Tax=Rhodococcus sp. SGAir0479 TaxID=2567884 RepID=UPI0010CD42BB|nr:D-isomer specific 2-hydroxyacid dehydrogenase family protein [Rhodococcus sp. SGAir0479]QCQ93262.1 hydroxyacid dehydrogenase [Rhodococcus sp. SGAir0479]